MLDEPFSNLDAGLRRQVRAEVRQILREAQARAIFVTHDQEEALSLADEVAVMIEGRIVQLGSPHQIYLRPMNREVATFVGEANFVASVAQGSIVSRVLGDLPLVEAAHGPVEALVRSEMVQLHLDPLGPGCVDRVSLPQGLSLQARTAPRLDLSPGTPVRVIVEGPVMVYPR